VRALTFIAPGNITDSEKVDLKPSTIVVTWRKTEKL
jgi:hypothetical protein